MNYRIFVESIKVEKDQRTKLVNFEGFLELRGQFTASGVASIYPQNGNSDPRANIKAEQGDTIPVNLGITNVAFSGTSTIVPIKAELWELEFGSQGNDDYGVREDSMILDGSSRVTKTIPVDISADNSKERGGRVLVTFVAEMQ
ncbi:hypothetical protein [Iningainema tapete]|uniref:Uncharacterized protein n=1 Tax=Iningainema tapete BLCC-T55 TaxID=2748662 RepID=A0A8J6XVD6_9CYAN|nr:hypothetical protein [Iningainema tapete]MBD2774388.1 hypothetical protein [Iningainema tapete BLCC-T55]